MDPLSALAIAAAVVQFADIGGRLMTKAWRKHRDRREQKQPDGENQWAQEAELEDALKQLFLFTRTVRDSTDRVVSDTTPDPAEGELVRLCEECEDIAKFFQAVLEQAKKRPARKSSQRDTRDKTELGGLWDTDTIRMMQDRLMVLQRSVTATIILCIWEDSKQTKKWEEDFGRKLNGIFSLVKKIEDSTGGARLPSANARNLDWLSNLSNLDGIYWRAGSSPGALEQSNSHGLRRDTRQSLSRGPDDPSSETRPTSDIVHVFSHIIASEKTNIGDEFKQKLRTESKIVGHIYPELTSRIWQRDWKPEHPVSETRTGPILAPATAEDLLKPMTNGLQFKGFDGREEAIARSFQSTYSWIFDRQPKTSHEGPLWHSFPDWLESTSDSVYWITGKPGSGKSTMMKYITQSDATMRHLETWSSPLPTIVVNYYAWIAGQPLQKSLDGLKRTVLYQAIKQQPGSISLICPRRWALANALPYNRRFPQWEDWEVEESFHLLLQNCGRTFKLVMLIDGLDEFDVDPREVVRFIGDISSFNSAEFLKTCVASRPWIQFDDAFSNVPLLQMHLLTKDDTITFITGNFNGNQGFREISSIYPTQVEELTEEIVSKARGVFLWVSIVVRSLLAAFSSGERSLIMWLADESKSTRVDLGQLPANFRERAAISLKRKLASRTKGILEIADDSEKKYVDFVHRTARDWVQQASVWEMLRASHREEFNLNFVLFEAETLALSVAQGSYWIGMKKALWYASQACGGDRDSERLVRLMDFFDESTQKYHKETLWPIDGFKGGFWYQMSQSPVLLHNGFLGLAALFSILPYVQVKIEASQKSPSRQTSSDYTSLLDCAVFGYVFFAGHGSYSDTRPLILPPIPVKRRLETVKFLVDSGSAPGPMFKHYMGRERIRCRTGDTELLDYYDEVCAYIKAKRSILRQARGALGRVIYVFRSSRPGTH